ncbi:MAG: XRE family transcriptional regulator [Paracoccaceae bacterium]
MIGAALTRERLLSGKTLSALAAEAGIAKSTLSQLEAGKGNPSVETLWALATALGIPFSQLFESPDPGTRLIRRAEGEAIRAEASNHAAVLLSSSRGGARRDLYRIAMEPGPVRRSPPHPPGTVEHAVLISGALRLGPEGATETLAPGDYFTFRGDLPHLYEALAPDTVFALAMDSA